jgi:hypothetical protein
MVVMVGTGATGTTAVTITIAATIATVDIRPLNCNDDAR